MCKSEKNPEILNQFIEKLKVDGKSENTIKCYSEWILTFVQFSKSIKYKATKKKTVKELDVIDIKNNMFKGITIDDIEKYKLYLTEEGNNGNSINRKLGSLKTFFDFLKQKKIVSENILNSVDKVKQSEKVREPLTKDEVELLLSTIKNSGSRYKERDLVLFLLYIELGTREFELTGLRLDQIKNNQYVIIEGKGDKERKIFISDMCIEALNDYYVWRNKFLTERDMESNYLFPSQQTAHLSKSRVFKMLKDYAELSGLNTEKVSPHVLRHTCATLKHESGADIREIQDYLGHGCLSTTIRYIGVSDKTRKTTANRVKLSF